MLGESVNRDSSTSSMSHTIEYLINCSKKCFNDGKYTFAKSYLMTASSLDEDNFLIKIETYKMCKTENNFLNTSKYFANLFCNPKLWNHSKKERQNPAIIEKENTLKNLFIDEMKNILYSISNEWKHCLQLQEFETFFNVIIINTHFYRQLWNQLQPEHQISCILKFCSFFPSKKELLIDLYLHIIIRYPCHDVIKSAIALIDLQEKFLKDFDNKLAQYLREKYTLYILPVLFSSDSYYTMYGNNESTLEKHFLTGLKYFIDDFLNNCKENQDEKKQTMLEKKLIEIVSLIGQHKKWNIFKKDQLNLDQIEANLETMSCYIHECFCKDNEVLDLSVKLDSTTYRKIAFYSIVLFVILFCRFMSKINNRVICEKLSGFSDGKPTTHLNLKKRKLMNYAPRLIASDTKLIDNVQLLLKFNTSIDFIRQEFDAYISQIELNKNIRYLQYKICHALHEADYNNAMHILKNIKYRDIVNNNFSNLLYWLQYYIQYLTFSIKLNHLKDAAVFIVKIIDLLCSSVSVDSGNPNLTFGYQLTQNLIGKDLNKFEISNQIESLIFKEVNYCSIEIANEYYNSRQMIFLCPTLENVIGLLIDACIILFSSITSDFTIGHTIVLSQYQWPYFYSAFHKSMLLIRSKVNQQVQPIEASSSKPSFIYPLFSSYIFVSDVIEEFKALVNDYEFSFQLEPNSIFKNNQEISVLLLNLINRPESGLQIDLFITFLIKEIKPFLASYLVNLD